MSSSVASTVALPRSEAEGSEDEAEPEYSWEDIFAEFGGVEGASFEPAEFAEISRWTEKQQAAQVGRPAGASDFDWLRARLQSLSPSEELSDAFLERLFRGREFLIPKMLETPVCNDKSMVPPELRAAQRVSVDLTLRPLPVVNVPRREAAPAKRRPRPTLPGSYTWEQITLSRFRERLLAHEKAASERMLRAWRDGEKAANKRPDEFVVPIDEVLEPWALPYYWDTRDKKRCVTMGLADEECPTLDADMADELGRHFPNKETLFRWRYGFTLKARSMPRTVTICSPHYSSFTWMQFLHDGFEAEVEQGWCDDGLHPPFLPGQYEAVGVAVKKHTVPPKPRRVTDKSYPFGWAVNEFIDMANDFAKLSFVRPEQHAEVAAVLGYLARLMGLPLLGFADDFKAWFNQLGLAAADLHLSGYVWVDKGGKVHYPFSRRVQFGGKPGPNCGQESMDFVLFTTRVTFRDELAVMEAEGWVHGAEAADSISHCLQLWRSRRRELVLGNRVETEEARLGEHEDGANVGSSGAHGQLTAAWDAGYIDDSLSLAVGLKRQMLWIVCFWLRCSQLRIPTAASKAQIGSTIKHLGLVFIYDLGLVVLPEDKLARLLEWCAKLARRPTAKAKEIESFCGTVNFCAVVRRDVRQRLFRLYRSMTVTFSHRYRRNGLIKITKGIKDDLKVIADRFASKGGVSCFPMDDWAEPGRPDHGAYQSDSCRGKDNLSEFSGMGGFFAGYFWWVKLSKAEVLELPVHVTEGVAKIVNLQLFGPFMEGGKIVEEVDSAPVADAFTGKTPKDPRLQELLLLGEALAGKHNVMLRTNYIATDDNTLADLLSRGRLRDFRKRAREMGYTELRELRPPASTKSLLSLLRRMTLDMRASGPERK